jgi:hypothetical protein
MTAAEILADLRGERVQLAELLESIEAAYLAPLEEQALRPAVAVRVAMLRQQPAGMLAAFDALVSARPEL